MMTESSGAGHPRLRAVLRPEIDAVPWLDPEDTGGGLDETGESIARAYRRMVGWTAANAIALLRLSLGVVFLWFGAPKFAPGISPAEGLAGATMAKLTFGLLDAKVAVGILAVWETAVGHRHRRDAARGNAPRVLLRRRRTVSASGRVALRPRMDASALSAHPS